MNCKTESYFLIVQTVTFSIGGRIWIRDGLRTTYNKFCDFHFMGMSFQRNNLLSK